MSIDGIIFDLGKTLMYLPDEYDLEARIASLIEKPKQEIITLVYDLCRRNLGMTAEEFIDNLSKKLNHVEDPVLDKAIRDICADSIHRAMLQPDAINALTALKSKGYNLALVSNTSPLSRPRIQKLGLVDHFDHIVFSCDMGLLKPDPRIFIYAMEKMETTPDHTCIIGDRIRTIILGGAILGSKLVLVERKMEKPVISEQLPIDAIVPSLDCLVGLPLLRKQ